MRVRVYRNLNKKTYSVLDWRAASPTKGRVIAHADELTLEKCQFVVQPAGREHVRNGGNKVVHAFIEGEWMGPIPPPLILYEAASAVRVRYDPRKGDDGFNVQGTLLTESPWIWLDPNGAWAPDEAVPKIADIPILVPAPEADFE